MVSAYKQRSGELANAYWQARWAHDEDEARRIYDSMDDIPADSLPEWVHEDLVAMADRFAMKERTTEDPDGETNGAAYCRGGWLPDDIGGFGIDRWLPDTGWVEREEWCNGFRRVWVNERLKATLTYCEGDLTIVIFPDDAGLRASIEDARKVYEGNRW